MSETTPLLGGGDDGRGRRGSVNAAKPAGGEYISPRERNMGIIGSIASVMNAVIGTGILALPVAFSGVGVVLGIVVMAVCALLCFVSLLGLGQVIVKVGGVSYGHTMDLAIGGAAGTIISAIVLAFCWGVCVIYSVVISANLTDLLFEQGLITETIIPGIENRQFWILATTVCVLIPLCMLPNFDKLKYAAMFATSSMVYLTGVIAGFLILSATRAAVPVWEAGREPVPAPPRACAPRSARARTASPRRCSTRRSAACRSTRRRTPSPAASSAPRTSAARRRGARSAARRRSWRTVSCRGSARRRGYSTPATPEISSHPSPRTCYLLHTNYLTYCPLSFCLRFAKPSSRLSPLALPALLWHAAVSAPGDRYCAPL